MISPSQKADRRAHPTKSIRTKFIQVHQWNEFAGLENGHGLSENYWGEAASASGPNIRTPNIYADEYNVQLSDDIEPTDPHACGYRGCGGWGYYYFNLTRAIISLYRGVTPDITVIALSAPATPVSSAAQFIDLHWAFLGRMPSSYSLSIDGKMVRHALQGSSYALSTAHMLPGQHEIKLIAKGVHTYFSLGPEHAAIRSPRALPVESEIMVNVGQQTGNL